MFIRFPPGMTPANSCWSSRRLQDMSWRRLQHVFSVTVFRLPRRLEDFLKTSWRYLARRLEDVLEDKKLLRWRRLQDVLKTSWRHVLKTCWRHVLKMPWRRLGDKQIVYWGYVFNHGLPVNLNQYLTNLYLINLYFTNLRRIRNALIRTQ